jgi:hypothetical protein
MSAVIQRANADANPCLREPRYGLLRFACNTMLRQGVRQNNSTGKSPESLSSPQLKNIPLNPSGKSALPTRPSHPMRGALRNVTNARWDAVDAALAKTNAR